MAVLGIHFLGDKREVFSGQLLLANATGSLKMLEGLFFLNLKDFGILAMSYRKHRLKISK